MAENYRNSLREEWDMNKFRQLSDYLKEMNVMESPFETLQQIYPHDPDKVNICAAHIYAAQGQYRLSQQHRAQTNNKGDKDEVDKEI